jgi:hypothetical protein
MDAPKTPNAVVVGHVNLPKPQAHVRQARPASPGRPGGERKQKRDDSPRNAREANMAQLQELQFLKRQINILKNSLLGYDDLRAAVAKVVEAFSVFGPEAQQASMASLIRVFKAL